MNFVWLAILAVAVGFAYKFVWQRRQQLLEYFPFFASVGEMGEMPSQVARGFLVAILWVLLNGIMYAVLPPFSEWLWRDPLWAVGFQAAILIPILLIVFFKNKMSKPAIWIVGMMLVAIALFGAGERLSARPRIPSMEFGMWRVVIGPSEDERVPRFCPPKGAVVRTELEDNSRATVFRLRRPTGAVERVEDPPGPGIVDLGTYTCVEGISAHKSGTAMWVTITRWRS